MAFYRPAALEGEARRRKDNRGRLVALVTEMLDLQRRRAEAEGHTRTLLDRRITPTDRRLDALVYERYDLTPAEIALVEAAAP